MAYKQTFRPKNGVVDFNRISSEVDAAFNLNMRSLSSNVVGSISPQKLTFKVNRANFYPFLPVAIIESEKVGNITVRIRYDWKSVVAQIFFLGYPTAFFLGSLAFILYYFSQEWGNLASEVYVIGAICFMSGLMLFAFLKMRSFIWQKTLERAQLITDRLLY